MSTVQSRRSSSPTSRRWMSPMKVTFTFPRPSLRPLAARIWQTKACTTPPRSTDLVPGAPECSDTWMMSPLVPMGLAVLTALKQTTGDPFMYKMMRRDQKLNWTFVICHRSEGLAEENAKLCQEELLLVWLCCRSGYTSGWGEMAASLISETECF